MTRIRKYEERYVAFLDILGFKNLVIQSEKDSKIYEIINIALNTFLEEKRINDLFGSFKVTTFSDNIVISTINIDNDDLFALMMTVIQLQGFLYQEGILLRGAITKGLIKHTNDKVFGPALNEAYILESEFAIYPRIIIKKEIYQDAMRKYKSEKFPCLQDISMFKNCLIQDKFNDILFLNTLDFESELDNGLEEYYEILLRLRDCIMEQINKADYKVKSKYVWLANYYNSNISKKKLDKDLMIDKKYIKL